MNIQECYRALGGSYDEVIGRLRSEKLVVKFTLKFLDDKSYELLCTSLKAEDYSEAFRAAHTLKGVCQNLGFTRLYKSSEKLTEALRGGKGEGTQQLLEAVAEDYRVTADAIKALEA